MLTYITINKLVNGQALLHVNKVLASEARTLRQAVILEPPQMETQGGNKIENSGTQVKYRRRIKRITLQRVLCSRIAYSLEKVTLDEILVLYDNLLFCQDLASKDESFRKKFGNSLEELTIILKSSNLQNEDPRKAGILFSKKFKNQLKGFLIPERNLVQVEQHLNKAYSLLPSRRPGDKLPNQPPPKKFIGVGYKDHGSRRDTAKDGSPSWQEVAMSWHLLDWRLR